MTILRKIVKWISTHRAISLLLLAGVIGLSLFVYRKISESSGIVSEPLKRGTIVKSVYGIGTVTAAKSYQIKSGITSTIDELYVLEGESVKKGASLLKVDRVMYKAPFDGVVTSLPNKAGENVFAEVPMLILVNLADRYVVVSLEQQGALHVLIGQSAILSFDTMRESNFVGTVKSIYSNSTNFLARIDIPNFPAKILPGMTADVAITIDTHASALLVPVAALENGKFVWIKGSGAKKVELKIGIVDKAFAEVLSGDLKEGDQVLIRKQAGP
jgi:multidrug efflux pump subunit AcrA (membrane-fusion protein)